MTAMFGISISKRGFGLKTTPARMTGVEAVRRQHRDVVIPILMMPEMDGLQVCREIRTFARAPILVLPAPDSPIHAESALNAGADDFPGKPVRVAIGLATGNNVIRQGGKNDGRLL